MHVIHQLAIGGMENGLVNLINSLPHNEFRHAVVCVEDYSDFRQRIERPDVDVIALFRSRVGVMGVRRSLYRLFRELRPRILHSRNQSGLDALPPAWLAGVQARVHGEHGWEMGNLDGRRWKPAFLRRVHAPFVHRYVTVSSDLRHFLVDRVGISRDRITTICNGVDTNRFAPARRPIDPGLPANFMDGDIVRIGTVGRLQPVKDQGTLVAAVAELAHRRRDLRSRIRLILVGDGPLRAPLQQQVEQRGIADLTWFAGAHGSVSDWMRVMDVFVLPSLNEGISNTLLEAMATGLPSLVTPVGGNVELVLDGQCGRFFEAGDAAGLAACLATYLDDPELRRAHGAAARLRAEGQFSLRSMVDGYRDLYRELTHADSR